MARVRELPQRDSLNVVTLAQIQVMWKAPPSGSGCVIFTAMVLENSVRWYAEDVGLTKTFCEMEAAETATFNVDKCCACDEAKYSVSELGEYLVKAVRN